MIDKIGVPIEVGDQVIYARSSGDSLHFGTVTGVFGDRAKIRNKDTGRVSVNMRFCSELLNIEIIKENCPEYFL